MYLPSCDIQEESFDLSVPSPHLLLLNFALDTWIFFAWILLHLDCPNFNDSVWKALFIGLPPGSGLFNFFHKLLYLYPFSPLPSESNTLQLYLMFPLFPPWQGVSVLIFFYHMYSTFLRLATICTVDLSDLELSWLLLSVFFQSSLHPSFWAMIMLLLHTPTLGVIDTINFFTLSLYPNSWMVSLCFSTTCKFSGVPVYMSLWWQLIQSCYSQVFSSLFLLIYFIWSIYE